MKYGMGWRGPEFKDPRDRKYYLAPFRFMGDIPKSADTPTPSVQNQFEVGSCVFKALTAAMEASEFVWWYSALYLYYRYRELYDNVAQDNGAYIRLACALAAKEGTPSEAFWPYGQGEKWNVKPPAGALLHRIESYWRLESLDEMLSCLASGYGFIGGFSLYESFMEVGRDGVVPYPNLQTERFVGGHAMYIKGYFPNERFIVQNSWGEEWGKKGLCYMPFDMLMDFGADFWTIRRMGDAV